MQSMFGKVMTGGVKSDQQQAGLNQNALTGLMDNIIMGDSRARQNMEGYGTPQQMQNMQQMQMMDQQYQQMMAADLMNKQFESMQINTMQNTHQQPNFFQGQQQDLNSIWDNTTVQSNNMQQQQQQQPGQQMFGAQPWMRPMNLSTGWQNSRIYEPSPLLLQQTKDIQEEQKEKPKEETKVSDVTKNMVDVLSNSTNPKHRNSKFLKFLNKLNYGAYTLENDQLVKHPEKIEQFRAVETQRRNDDLLQQIQSQRQPETQIEEVYRDILKDDPELTGEQFEEMMKEWMQGGTEMQNMEQMMADWGKQWDQNYQLQIPQAQPLIPFQPDNPYLVESTKKSQLDSISNLDRAKQLVEQGKVQEAILCLEAEVQTNQQNSEAWRLLGQLFQENDQDDFAILAFKAAHDIDPYDLDSLMMLGVSCTNELVEKDAKNYLHEWLKYHPDFQGMPGIQELPELDFLQLKEAFDAAHLLKPADTQVLMALGILNFIQRDYMSAGQCFVAAIKENPTDHTLWNKFGACMSNNMNIPQAIQAYEQALDLRPNYVRTIVNLGLAKNRMNDHKAAANCFLNALMLNPNVSQAWTYLRQSFMKMSRFDLLEKLEARDPMIFKDEFLLIDPKNLQAPSMDRLWTQDILNN